jgi:hypothetical protein
MCSRRRQNERLLVPAVRYERHMGAVSLLLENTLINHMHLARLFTSSLTTIHHDDPDVGQSDPLTNRTG